MADEATTVPTPSRNGKPTKAEQLSMLTARLRAVQAEAEAAAKERAAQEQLARSKKKEAEAIKDEMLKFL